MTTSDYTRLAILCGLNIWDHHGQTYASIGDEGSPVDTYDESHVDENDHVPFSNAIWMHGVLVGCFLSGAFDANPNVKESIIVEIGEDFIR